MSSLKVVDHYRRLEQVYPEYLILLKRGDNFYETYGDTAEYLYQTYSEDVCTGYSETNFMAGWPLTHQREMLSKVCQGGKKVLIFEVPLLATGLST